MLTHQNVIAGISAVLVQLGEHKPSYKDTMISFLPLAHMLERCCENGMYMVGGSVGFYSGDIKRLSEDMKALRPTVMPAVPRLLNRMYDKVGCLIITSIESYYNWDNSSLIYLFIYLFFEMNYQYKKRGKLREVKVRKLFFNIIINSN